MVIVVVLLALVFDFTNGFHDSANLVATVISSRSMEPETALIMAAVAEFIGAYFLGTAVAKTIGKGIVDPTLISASSSGAWVILSAVLAAILWNLATWWFGLPSSSSHALIGGLLGAFVMGWGIAPVQWKSVGLIILIMVLSPVVGLAVTYLFTEMTMLLVSRAAPKINKTFKHLQVLSCLAQALSHGTNDAQKTMGLITFSLILLGFQTPVPGELPIQRWVIIACALAMAMGTVTGGWRIIKKLGAGLYRVRPVHGFASQSAAAAIIYLTAIFGFPVSTTQVISSSVMGAGAAFRPKMVRWGVAGDMAIAWLITIPASAFIAALSYAFIKGVFL